MRNRVEINSAMTDTVKVALQAMVFKDQWKDADPAALEPWYSYWVSELTGQGIHAKSDVAMVLAILSDRLAKTIVPEEGALLAMRGLLETARCPNTTCQDGVIAHQVGEQEWEPEQCQWCDERQAMLAQTTRLQEKR